MKEVVITQDLEIKEVLSHKFCQSSTVIVLLTQNQFIKLIMGVNMSLMKVIIMESFLMKHFSPKLHNKALIMNLLYSWQNNALVLNAKEVKFWLKWEMSFRVLWVLALILCILLGKILILLKDKIVWAQ